MTAQQLTQHIYPPRSPDLTPLDYFFFLILKNTIFEQPVDPIEDLKVKMRNAESIYVTKLGANSSSNCKFS